MKKIIKGYFYVDPGYVNSVRKEDFEIEFDETDSEEIIEKVLQDHFNDFLTNIDMGWVIEKE